MNGAPDDITRAFAAAGLTVPGSRAASLLFFSGGSALKDVARAISALTPDTVHVVSTFDSGGSTAELRRAFNTPAVGDLRLRLSSLSGRMFFERRLGAASVDGLAELDALVDAGSHNAAPKIANGMSEDFRELLEFFRRVMPPDFNLRGAALGNLIIAADYLRSGRSLYESIERISTALSARGRVLPVSEDPVHLAVRLESGECLAGQHRFTGKQMAAPSSPISGMFFCRGLCDLSPATVRPARGVLDAIGASGLICYPVGSFYSSVLANLRVEGVGEAVRRSRAKKVYMPNPDRDPESAHLSLKEQLEALCLAVSGGDSASAAGVVDYLLLDTRAGKYRGGVPNAWCERQRVKIIDLSHVENDLSGRAVLSPERSAFALLRLSSICSLA